LVWAKSPLLVPAILMEVTANVALLALIKLETCGLLPMPIG
jgi:hypothetical protein